MRHLAPFLVLLSLSACRRDQADAAAPAASATTPPAVSTHAAPAASSSAPAAPPDPRQGFEELRKHACDKDVAGFFKMIDREKMIDAGTRFAPELNRATITKLRDEADAEWTKDIDRGDKGFWCQMEYVSTDGNEVTARGVSGSKKKFTFERRGDRWMVVNYGSVKEK